MATDTCSHKVLQHLVRHCLAYFRRQPNRTLPSCPRFVAFFASVSANLVAGMTHRQRRVRASETECRVGPD